MNELSEVHAECLIVGGGPSGLTAAIYLSRFRRNVILCDDNSSRASLIPISFNYPGFTQGISGPELLKNLHEQAHNYGVNFYGVKILNLKKTNNSEFIGYSNTHKFIAKSVIIATGIIDNKPSFPSMSEFIYQEAIRFCPICDGYEAINKRIAIYGSFSRAFSKAQFLRTYSKDITLLMSESYELTDKEQDEIRNFGIKVVQVPIVDLELSDYKINAVFADGDTIEFDVLYPAMGSIVRSELAKKLGANISEDGQLIADSRQMTNIKGLYAIGDVVKDLAQITVGIGHAAVAATAIHNSLEQVF